MKKPSLGNSPKITDFDKPMDCWECQRQVYTVLFLKESGKYLCRDCFRDSVMLIEDAKRQGQFVPGLNSYLGGGK